MSYRNSFIITLKHQRKACRIELKLEEYFTKYKELMIIV